MFTNKAWLLKLRLISKGKVLQKDINLKVISAADLVNNWLDKTDVLRVLPEEKISNLISVANSLEELKGIIRGVEGIWNYTSNHLVRVIENYRNGSWELTGITRTAGLRDKVFWLKNNEVIQRSSLSALWPKWLNFVTKQWRVWN